MLLQAALVVSRAWPAIFHIVLQLLSPSLPKVSSNAVQVTEKLSKWWPQELPVLGRQHNICSMFGENPVGWRAGRKSGRKAFLSSLKRSLVFKARERGPDSVFSLLPCLFCIIL